MEAIARGLSVWFLASWAAASVWYLWRRGSLWAGLRAELETRELESRWAELLGCLTCGVSQLAIWLTIMAQTSLAVFPDHQDLVWAILSVSASPALASLLAQLVLKRIPPSGLKDVPHVEIPPSRENSETS